MDSKTAMELYTKIYQSSVFYKTKVKYNNIILVFTKDILVFNWKGNFILNSIVNIKNKVLFNFRSIIGPAVVKILQAENKGSSYIWLALQLVK